MSVTSTARTILQFVTLAVVGVAPASAQTRDLVLSPERAAIFELGTTIDEVYRLVGREQIRLVDLFSEGHFTPAIEINVGSADPNDVRKRRCPDR